MGCSPPGSLRPLASEICDSSCDSTFLMWMWVSLPQSGSWGACGWFVPPHSVGPNPHIHKLVHQLHRRTAAEIGVMQLEAKESMSSLKMMQKHQWF